MLQSCMEPDADNLWSISIENVFETKGFARSVTFDGKRLMLPQDNQVYRYGILRIILSCTILKGTRRVEPFRV